MFVVFSIYFSEISFVPASRLSGHVEVDDVLGAIRPTTVLVSLMMANNETGVIQVFYFMFYNICKHIFTKQFMNDKNSGWLAH